MEQAAHTCYEEIVKLNKRPLFVGVTGDSGSGKSYLVDLLIKEFEKNNQSFSLINHDDFLISRHDREPMKEIYYSEGRFKGKSHWEILENMFRLDEYKRVIHELKAGNKAEFKPYSRETGTVLDEKRIVEPCDYIIFDTSMMLDEMDFVILVDVTQDNIIKRKLVRDSDVRTPEQIMDMHKRVQGYYWTDRGMPEHADIVIDNNDFSNVKFTLL